MVQIGYLTAKFEADVAKFVSDVGKAGKSLESLEKTVSGTVKSINGSLGALGATAGLAGLAAGIVSAGAAAVTLGDQYQVLQTRIRGVSESSTKEYKQLSDQLYTISQRNGVALETTAQAFQQIARNAKGFGATNADVAKLTNAVQQLGVVSGTSGESMKSAMLQFSQAMGSGVLQGDELKSIMENMPVLADKLAKGLGVSRGELKKMGAEGQLTSDLVFKTLLKQTDEINKEFEKMPANMGQAMSSLQNSAMRAVGEFDRLFNVSGSIAQTLKGFSASIDATTNASKKWLEQTHQVALAHNKIASNAQVLRASFAYLFDPQHYQKLFKMLVDPLGATVDAFAFRKTQFEDFRKALDQVTEADKKLEVQQQKHAESIKKSNGLGLPSDKDLEKYLQQQKNILDTFDLDKVFADKVQNIAGDQVAAMTKFTNALLDSTKDKIEELEAYKKSLGDSNADKAAKKSIDLQLDKYKQLKKELEEQNKQLEKQWALVEKVAEATAKQAQAWKEEANKEIIERQKAYDDRNASAAKQIEQIKKETELLRQKRSGNAEDLAEQEALNKLGFETNDLYFARRKLLEEMKQAQAAYKEEVAATKAEESIEKMKESNDLLQARLYGLEEEYQAQKKLKDLLKDIRDPAKIDEYTRKYKEQLATEKDYKDAIEKQKKVIDDVKSSTESYTQKVKQLSNAWNSGAIKDAKLYKDTLEELQKKQLENVKKSTTEWTNKLFDGLSRAVVEGKNLKDVFKDLGKELGLLAAKKMVFEPIANAIGNYASKLYGGTMFGAPGSTGGPAVASGGGGLLAGLGGLFGGLFGGGSKMPPLAPNYSKAPSIAGLPQSGSVSGNGSALSGGGLAAGPMAAGYDGKPIGSDIMGSVAPAWFREWYTKSHTNVVGIGSAMKVIDGAMYALLQSCGGSDSLATKFDYIGDIRNTLKFAELSTSGGTALRVWVANFGAEDKPQGMFKNPLRSGNSNALKDTGNGGFSLYADNLIPLIQSLTAMSSKGLAWKVINPDCPCGPSGDLKSPTITGSSGGLMPSPALSDPSGVLRGAYNPSADQIARANGTYKSPTISLSGGVSTMPTTGMTGAWAAQQRGLNGTLLPTSGMIGSAPEYDEYMRRAAAMKQAGNFFGTMPTQANFKASSAVGFTPDSFVMSGSPYALPMPVEDYTPTKTPGFSGGVNKSPMYAPWGAGTAGMGAVIQDFTNGYPSGTGIKEYGPNAAYGGTGIKEYGPSSNVPYGPNQYGYGAGPNKNGTLNPLYDFNVPDASVYLTPEQRARRDALLAREAAGGSSFVNPQDYLPPAPPADTYRPITGNPYEAGSGADGLIHKGNKAYDPQTGALIYDRGNLGNRGKPGSGLLGFANGGFPPVGVPSIVGERGPELFVPQQSGVVLPNDRLKSIMGGGNTPVVHLHDYTETKSQISDTRFAQDGSLHITLRDVVANLQNDPKVRKAANKATGTKSRGRLKT